MMTDPYEKGIGALQLNDLIERTQQAHVRTARMLRQF
jgi:hypothetical protein